MALVSVMMPCRNAAATLPMALASLTAQSHRDWECILVDDHSDDDSRIVIERIGEPRVRYIRLDQWSGRGYARQMALDAAKGEYICMLDADDWYYPEKLSVQLAFLESQPAVDLVSTGMAIVDRQGVLTGVRSGVKNAPTSGASWPGLYPPPMAHGPTMMRRAAVAGATYDSAYTRAEDSDFLSQVLEEHAWAILPDISYVYAEYTTATPANTIAAHRAWLRHLRGYSRRLSWAQMQQIVITSIKLTASILAYGLNLSERAIQHRSQSPTPKQVAAFELARGQVMTVLEAQQTQ